MSQQIDLLLNSHSPDGICLKTPAFSNYTPPFGEKVTQTPQNYGGLSLQEVNDNIIAPFVAMRGINVSDNSYTTQIEYDAKLIIDAADSIQLSIGNSYAGCKLTIVNSTTFEHTLVYGEGDPPYTSLILPKTIIKLVFDGTAWKNLNAPFVGKIIAQYPQEKEPSDIYPCTLWEEVTDYDGAFFRTSGGSADPFIEEGGTLTPQPQSTAVNGLTFTGSQRPSGNQSSNPSFNLSNTHYHTFTPDVQKNQTSTSSANFFKKGTDISYKRHYYKSFEYRTDSYTPSSDYKGSVTKYHTHSFIPNGTVNSQDIETRPINYTVRYWKRIA